jgi:hypothetical protein
MSPEYIMDVSSTATYRVTRSSDSTSLGDRNGRRNGAQQNASTRMSQGVGVAGWRLTLNAQRTGRKIPVKESRGGLDASRVVGEQQTPTSVKPVKPSIDPLN